MQGLRRPVSWASLSDLDPGTQICTGEFSEEQQLDKFTLIHIKVHLIAALRQAFITSTRALKWIHILHSKATIVCKYHERKEAWTP